MGRHPNADMKFDGIKLLKKIVEMALFDPQFEWLPIVPPSKFYSASGKSKGN